MTIFLDLDGTIIDSFERHFLLLREILKKYKVLKNIDKNYFFKLKRDGINNYNYLVNYLSLEENIALLIKNEWINKIENLKWLRFDKLYDDALYFLKEMKNNNIIFLTARKNKNNLMKQLEKLDIKKYAQKTYVVNPDNPIENKSKIVEEYIFNNSNENTVIIGDTEVEYYTACKTNIEYYILNRGFRSIDYLKNRGINKTYYDLYDILKEVQSEKCKEN